MTAETSPAPTPPHGGRVIAEGTMLLYSDPKHPATMVRPSDLPGIVIFIHGVNDPGSSYETVETGLCQGLNERLGRGDLSPGLYGAQYQELKAAALPPEDPLYEAHQSILLDPDSYLYARTFADKTNSMFVPFTWGYRAANGDIAREPEVDDPLMVRGQYQDVRGNRLDKKFAKQGGFFANATSTLPDMYGEGFKSGALTDAAQALFMDDYQRAADGPPRRYFVLAAERLATLVQSIRSVQFESGRLAANETITVICHSQGGMIALLAQALLVDRKARVADTVILVDPPYSLNEPGLDRYTQTGDNQITTQARLNTLLNIVRQTQQDRHATPPLKELEVHAPCNHYHGGRSGRWWSEHEGRRRDPNGQEIVFAERDNRGKVYLYFCPQDTTVDNPTIQGIGSGGVPDTISAPMMPVGGPLLPTPRESVPALAPLADAGLRQRMWSRKLRDGEPILVGLPGETFKIGGQPVAVNGEPLNPPHKPQLYGGEEIRGDAENSGWDQPDAVSINSALGNSRVKDRFVPWKTLSDEHPPDLETLKAEFNHGKIVDDQTAWVKAMRVRVQENGNAPGYQVIRAETPNETRHWREHSEAALSKNSYHSAILRDTENHRWVTAMDVAIGQAVTLDDPQWRELWLAMGDWRMPLTRQTGDTIVPGIAELPNYALLSDSARKLIRANADYYWRGVEPPEKLVSQSPPTLVDCQTRAKRNQDAVERRRTRMPR